MKRDIFISYSRNDLDAVLRIKEEIEVVTGKECWMDLNSIESGSVQFAKDIIVGIKDSKVFLFMLSESSQNSEFALRELNFAYNQARDCDKKVVIVNVTGCKMSDEFAFMYGLTDTITWNNTPQHDKLIRDLKRWLGDTKSVDSEAWHMGKEKAREEERKRSEEEEAKRKAKEEQRRIAEEKTCGAEKARQHAVEAKQDKVFDVYGVQFKMIYVQGGTFKMGATPEQESDAFGDESPVHDVTLSDFHIGETPVTQALWKAVMGRYPSSHWGDDLPVETVTWNDCQEFVKNLNELTGKKFRLPTEAEWEYAARGGNKSKGYKYAGSNSLRNVAWYEENSGYETHPVKTKLPNELGLYDMSGNVWEWCSMWCDVYTDNTQTNPKDPSTCSYIGYRGGSCMDSAERCHIPFWIRCSSTAANITLSCTIGLRLVLVP